MKNGKCETRADCFREYARVIEMCEAAGVSTEGCVTCNGLIGGSLYSFNADPKRYEFARCIIDGVPVFDGDVVYTGDVAITMHCALSNFADLSLKPVRKTVMFNGEALPIMVAGGRSVVIFNVASPEAADLWAEAIRKAIR